MGESSEHSHVPQGKSRSVGEGKSEDKSADTLTEPFASDANARDPYFDGRLVVLKDGLSANYEDAVRLPVGATPRTWPQLLHNAVGQVCPNGEYMDAEYLANFERRYGPCSMVHLVALARRYAALHINLALVSSAEESVVDTGDMVDMDAGVDIDHEILFVLLMLGVWPEHPQADRARGILVEFLTSPKLIERMQSAISLGHLRDERAIPVLLRLLTDELPQMERDDGPHDTRDRATRDRAWWEWNRQRFVPFQATALFRREIPRILARWGVRSAVQPLRQTLVLMTHFERVQVRRNPQWWLWRQYWWMYQQELVEALARLGAFGALVGIEPLANEGVGYGAVQAVSESATDTSRADTATIVYRWRVAMCRAVVSQRYEEAGRHGVISAATVRSEVKRLLAELFGLDEEECRTALEPYMDQHLRLELA